jgi:Tfp pilus assembly protein PilN
MLFLIRNAKNLLIAGLIAALVVGYISWKNSIYEEVEREVTLEQQENYIETRKRIDEATSTTKSPDAALERLRERQLQRQKGE